jgi:hypothetical protein
MLCSSGLNSRMSAEGVLFTSTAELMEMDLWNLTPVCGLSTGWLSNPFTNVAEVSTTLKLLEGFIAVNVKMEMTLAGTMIDPPNISSYFSMNMVMDSLQPTVEGVLFTSTAELAMNLGVNKSQLAGSESPKSVALEIERTSTAELTSSNSTGASTIMITEATDTGNITETQNSANS